MRLFNKISTYIFISSVLGLSACNKDFLDTTSYSQVQESNFWKNGADATAGVNAVYDALQGEDSFGLYNMTDIISPIAAPCDNPGGMAEFCIPGTNATSGFAAMRWRGLYRGVYRANLCLEKIPGINMDEVSKKRLLAEAKFLRAFNYFYLINFFGDVPLITKTLGLEEATTPTVERTPVADVRAQIYKDLDEAYADLPVSYTKSDLGRATKYAARTLKGKVQLYEGNFAAAAATFKEVIDSKNYKLYDHYFNLFDYKYENNSEVIFDIQFNNVVGTGEGNRFEKYLGNRESSSNGWTNIQPTVYLVDNYEMKDGLPAAQSPLFNAAKPYDNRDPRMDFTIIRPGASYRNILFKDIRYDFKTNNIRTGYLVRKAVTDENVGLAYDTPTNLILMRYGDVLLMYAEAQNEVVGADQTVYDAVNAVRQRPSVAMPPILQGKTQAEMRAIIRHERMIEMALEGHYYFDIKRWRIAETAQWAVYRPKDDNFLDRVAAQPNRVFLNQYYLLPIPQGERDKNPKLVQNPGYN
ncbi:RagB/SusD family nutrient uptake outer membrane protein [Solitalea lacus]|uniref:RagB/SusD family nutrient uptake outer membrane protein n=1 Tax=Solitalea lacus TaxID=2911172 RepID=UPI001EDBFCAE|nr:RagB/SusD family nutrient uptake outer membrane protein [Solitalea lacus]UKJ07440.1 RagB/SusD family nutrient uptake outer membrane protein [Solitalea lacus]